MNLSRLIPKNPWLFGVYLFIFCILFSSLLIDLCGLYIFCLMLLLSFILQGYFYSKLFQTELTLLNSIKANSIIIFIAVYSSLIKTIKTIMMFPRLVNLAQTNGLQMPDGFITYLIGNISGEFIGGLFVSFLLALALKTGSKIYMRYRRKAGDLSNYSAS